MNPDGKMLRDSLKNLNEEYKRAVKENGLSEKTEVFRRFYLSDIANQHDVVVNSEIFQNSKECATSIIQQCPLQGGLVSFFAYHIKNKRMEKTPLVINNQNIGSKISGLNYDLLVTTSMSDGDYFDLEFQTRSIFSSYNSLLRDNGCSLLKNTVRTWIYVRDIDNHYHGMVKARREFFARNGLTKDTRFVASTGIEGKSKKPNALVSMDALSFTRLDDKQIVRMEAKDHLSPTYEYGVTFERGTRIDWGDRSHLHISGTASIDEHGKVVRIFDVENQTKRIIENIKALLKPHKATMRDMAYLVVYVRNINDMSKVKNILHEFKYDKLPIFYLEGAVCRPEWLVEIEGLAIIKSKSKWPVFL